VSGTGLVVDIRRIGDYPPTRYADVFNSRTTLIPNRVDYESECLGTTIEYMVISADNRRYGEYRQLTLFLTLTLTLTLNPLFS